MSVYNDYTTYIRHAINSYESNKGDDFRKSVQSLADLIEMLEVDLHITDIAVCNAVKNCSSRKLPDLFRIVIF